MNLMNNILYLYGIDSERDKEVLPIARLVSFGIGQPFFRIMLQGNLALWIWITLWGNTGGGK
jgi:hypothetical protein